MGHMKVFSISDIHADYHDNRQWVLDLSTKAFSKDALIVAGDISHRLSLIKEVLSELRSRFAKVFFVPGNHDLWIRSAEEDDSLLRFRSLVELCGSLDVSTSSTVIGAPEDRFRAYVVPLFSWYERPESSETSLFIEKQGEDPSLAMWVDNWSIRWPGAMDDSAAARHFLELNAAALARTYDGSVITFSHFMPRRELMFPTVEELAGYEDPPQDPAPTFNFSRVAGSTLIEDQLRKLTSSLHIYGHQHRNRRVSLDGVLYLSSCLGYPKERRRGRIRGIDAEPMLIWDSQRRIILEPETLSDWPTINDSSRQPFMSERTK